MKLLQLISGGKLPISLQTFSLAWKNVAKVLLITQVQRDSPLEKANFYFAYVKNERDKSSLIL